MSNLIVDSDVLERDKYIKHQTIVRFCLVVILSYRLLFSYPLNQIDITGAATVDRNTIKQIKSECINTFVGFEAFFVNCFEDKLQGNHCSESIIEYEIFLFWPQKHLDIIK